MKLLNKLENVLWTVHLDYCLQVDRNRKLLDPSGYQRILMTWRGRI